MSEAPVWSFLFGILSVYFFFPLRHVPVMDRLKIPFKKLMFYATIIVLIQGFSYLWLSELYPFGSVVLTWHRKLFMIPYVLLTLTFSKDSKGKTLFMDFLMIGIVMAVIDIAYVLDRTWFSTAFANAPHRTDVFIRITLTALLYPPLYVVFKKYLRPIMKLQSMTLWRYMTTIPFVFGLISIITTMEAFDHRITPVILAIRFAIIGGSVLVCILLGKVMTQMEIAIKASENNKHAKKLLALQADQYQALTKNIEQTRAAKHDLRHHLAAISAMVERQEYENLREFVEQYGKTILTDTTMVICENYAANSVLSHYIALAQEEDIETVDVRCVLGVVSGIEDTDLCVLLGNLLENAIEGCKTIPKEERRIKLRIATYVGELMITLDNTFDGVVEIEEDDYISRKRPGKLKGVGLSSVAMVVEKYGGELCCEQKDTLFMVSVKMMVG